MSCAHGRITYLSSILQVLPAASCRALLQDMRKQNRLVGRSVGRSPTGRRPRADIQGMACMTTLHQPAYVKPASRPLAVCAVYIIIPSPRVALATVSAAGARHGDFRRRYCNAHRFIRKPNLVAGQTEKNCIQVKVDKNTHKKPIKAVITQ